jgi:rare lipoprotein A
MRMLSKSLPVVRHLHAAMCVVSTRGQTVVRVTGVAGLAVLMANCSQAPQGSRLSSQESREIGFFSHRKFGPASPRVVADGQAVPKGGGRDHVGRSYTIAGKRYTPYVKPVGYVITGSASWYGPAFHGRKTANGEIYDRHGISAAHPTMPLPSYARVTNLGNRRSIIVRVNDRGPYHGGRILDVSERTAHLLGFKHLGTTRVKVDYLGPASLAGSDDTRLMASLRTNGPAIAPTGPAGPVMVASTAPVASAVPNTNRTLAFTAQAPAQVPASQPQAANAGVITATRFTPAPELPLPPARPFDLETIGGAAAPVVPVSGQGGLPRAAPVELALSETAGLLGRFGQAASGEQHWIRTPLRGAVESR